MVGLLVACMTACSGASTSASAACRHLSQPVVLPAGTAHVLERVVGTRPTLLDILVRPWMPADQERVRVFLRLEHAGEIDELAEHLRRAGYTITATLDQEQAYQEFALLFQASPDLVKSVTAKDLPASVNLEATTPAARAQIKTAMKDDPRVKEVVLGQDTPSIGDFAVAVYDVARNDLDRLEEALADDRAAEVRALRALALRGRTAQPMSLEAAMGASDLARRFTEFAASRCGLDPGRT